MCHICAAEEGGERFVEAMANEERRHFDNLLLLCHPHHVITDDVDAYPIEKMRQIKDEHESRFRHGLASMMESSGIEIVDSMVMLGGQGGVLGGGGGGGGAIGPSARGGDGGAGTPFMRELFDAIGTGDATQVLGLANQVLSTQRLAKELRSNSVYVATAVLANYAEFRNEMLYIVAGGWKTYNVSFVPQVVSFYVAILLLSQLDEAEIAITLDGPAGTLLRVDCTIKFSSQEFWQLLPIQGSVSQAEIGIWTMMVKSKERELYRLPFEVKLIAG